MAILWYLTCSSLSPSVNWYEILTFNLTNDPPAPSSPTSQRPPAPPPSSLTPQPSPAHPSFQFPPVLLALLSASSYDSARRDATPRNSALGSVFQDLSVEVISKGDIWCVKISLSGLLGKFKSSLSLVLKDTRWVSVNQWVGMHTYVYIFRSGAGECVFGFRLES
jgi:hypothetical protein